MIVYVAQKTQVSLQEKNMAVFCQKPLEEKPDTLFVSVIIKRAKKRYLAYAQAHYSTYLETQICGAVRYLTRLQSVFQNTLQSAHLDQELDRLIKDFETIKEKKLQNAA